MRLSEGVRVFERADWRRKVRMPERMRREQDRKSVSSPADSSTTGKW